MKVTGSSSFYATLLTLLSLGSAWGFSLSPLTTTTTSSSTTQLGSYYSRRGGYGRGSYGSSWDDDYAGSSFLQGNMVNDPYAFERGYDRNKDDIKISPYSMYDDDYYGLYDNYYGRSSYGRRISPYYNEDYSNVNYYNNGYNNNFYSPYRRNNYYGNSYYNNYNDGYYRGGGNGYYNNNNNGYGYNNGYYNRNNRYYGGNGGGYRW